MTENARDHATVDRREGEDAENVVRIHDRRHASTTPYHSSIGSFDVDCETGSLTCSAGLRDIYGFAHDAKIDVEGFISYHPEDLREGIGSDFGRAVGFGDALEYTAPITSNDGHQRWVYVVGQVCGAPRQRLFGTVKDVTQARETDERLRMQVHQDELTGLPNRRAFQIALKAGSVDPVTSPMMAVCVIDVDMFKNVNDVHGHAFGDALLKEMSRRFHASVRRTDVVARLGGDEFAIILHGIKHRDDAELLGNRLVSEARRPFEHENVVHLPSISLGMRVSGVVNPDPDMLVKQADIALYRAKQEGRDRFRLFDPTLCDESDGHKLLLSEVAIGLKRGEFRVHYQPAVEFGSRSVTSWEALVRWNHPTQGLLTPGSFMPAIQDPFTSVAIDDFVLGASLAQMRRWIDEGVPVRSVAVNLSETCLKRANLVQMIEGLLARYELTPDRLRVEVQESTFTGRSPEAVGRTIDALANLGVECALDDFGTGVGSLSNLKRFRIERIKIDRSFVSNMVTVASFDHAITKSMVELGINLGIKVTAEGVENGDQLNLLRKFGCNHAMGHLFSRPMPPEAAGSFLRDWDAFLAERLLGPGRRHATPADVVGIGAGGLTAVA